MNRFLILILALLLHVAHASQAESLKVTGGIDISFYPEAKTAEVLVKEIGQAGREIIAQTFFLTCEPIAKALTEAKGRGVAVRVVSDKGLPAVRKSAVSAGIPANLDLEQIIEHNRSVVIDRQTFIAVPFDSAQSVKQKKSGQLLIVRGNRALIEKYIKHFQKHKD